MLPIITLIVSYCAVNNASSKTQNNLETKILLYFHITLFQDTCFDVSVLQVLPE